MSIWYKNSVKKHKEVVKKFFVVMGVEKSIVLFAQWGMWEVAEMV